MDTNYQNIFGNPKSAHGTYTCGVCFQEFVHYNDMAIHERMHIEQMSLASLQTHLLPQFDNRATVLSNNLQASLRPQIDSRALGIGTTVSPVLSQSVEKRPPSVGSAVQSSLRSQLDVSRTSAFDSSVIYSKGADSPSIEPQVTRTHTELKTPTYTLITSYDKDFQQPKRTERIRSQNEPRANLFDTGTAVEKVPHSASDLGSVIRPHVHKSPPLYEVTGNPSEKNIMSTRSDFNISGLTQSDPRTTLYDLTALEKSIQLTHLENPLQKSHVETITLYPENLHLETYGKKQVLPTPTVIPVTVADYSRQSLSRHDDYQINNIQYQVPVSTVRQNSQYSIERLQPTPNSVSDLPVSTDYHKRQNEETTVVPTVSQTAYSGIPSYVQATLSYSQFNPINSSLFKPDQFHSAPQVYQRLDSHDHLAQEPLEKAYPENYSQNHYQVHEVSVSSSNVTSTSTVDTSQTQYYSESNTSLPVTSGASSHVVFASSIPTKKQPPAIVLSDGTYYPSGLPIPELPSKSQGRVTEETKANENATRAIAKTTDSTTCVLENVEDLNKKQEFVDMIKMVQGERRYSKRVRCISESSDNEDNESAYEYKVDIACFICSEEFEKEKKLFKHLHKHRKNGELSAIEESDEDGEKKTKKLCKYCGKQFIRVNQLIEHIRKHTAEKPYECRFCDKGYAMKPRCMKHEATHNKEEVGIHCEVCDTVLENKALYLFHVHEHILDEDKKEAEVKQQEFVDMIRSMQSVKPGEKEKGDAEDQMLNLLLDFEKEQLNSKKASQETENKTPESTTCRICPETVLKKDFLKHFRVHKIYICHECKRGFTRKLNYKYHSDTLHLKEEDSAQVPVKRTFICTICEKIFSKKSRFKRHIETHVDDPVVKCDVCEKSFFNKGDYFFHLNMHDIDDLAELNKVNLQKKLKNEPKKDLKIKISNKKVQQGSFSVISPEKEELSCISALRQREKRKPISNYSLHGNMEETSKKKQRERDKRKQICKNSPDQDHPSKRVKRQTDQYSEKLTKGAAHFRKLRKRKPINYDDEDDGRENDETYIQPVHDEERYHVRKGAVQHVQNQTAVDQNQTIEVENILPELLGCKVCKKQIPKPEFIAHFKTHNFMSCEVCERSFIRRNSYISHMKHIHQKDVSEEYLEKTFPKFSEIKNQKQKEKNEEKQDFTVLKDQTLKKQNDGKQNVVKVKGQNPKEETKEKGIPVFGINKMKTEYPGYHIKSETENPFICILCEKRFNKKSSVVNHIKIHFNVDEPKPDISNSESSGYNNTQTFVKYEGSSEQNSENYVITQSEAPPKIQSYYCGICKRTITRRSNFESHMKARHSKVIEESKQIETEQARAISVEPKLKLGIDVRSPPKKRKIFVEDVFQEEVTSVVSSNFTSDMNSKIKAKFSSNLKEPWAERNDFTVNRQGQGNLLHSDSLQFSKVKQTKHKNEHKGKTDLKQIEPQNVQNVFIDKTTKSFPKFCPVCHKKQKSLRNFEEHFRTHTGDKPYKCDICGHEFSRERNCNSHMKKCRKSNKQKARSLLTIVGEQKGVNLLGIGSKDSMYGASTLTESDADLGGLNQYDKSDAIDLSAKESTVSSGFLKHKAAGTKSKAVSSYKKTFSKKCPICFTKINSKVAFDLHLNGHSERKPFSCKFCGKCFENKSQLYNHRKTHIVEKPSNADYSSEDSAVESTFRHSKTSVHKPGTKANIDNSRKDNLLDLVCKLCYANFMTKAAFETHLQLHAEEENEDSEIENDTNLSNICEETSACIQSVNEIGKKILLSSSKKVEVNMLKYSSRNTDSNSSGAYDQGDNKTDVTQVSIVNGDNNDLKMAADKHVIQKNDSYGSDLDLPKDKNLPVRTNKESSSASTLHTDKNKMAALHDPIAQSSIEGCKTKENDFEFSASESDTSKIIEYVKNSERTSEKLSCSVQTEACIKSDKQTQEIKNATTETEKNRKMDCEVSFRPEDSNACKSKDIHKTHEYDKSLNKTEEFTNLCIDNEALKYRDNLPVVNHLNNLSCTCASQISSQISSRSEENEELFGDKDSFEDMCEHWTEQEPESPRSLKSQNVVKMSPESAYAKWKLKVESVLISQLELNEKRKQNSDSGLEHLSFLDRDRVDKSEMTGEILSGNMERYECRLCGDIFDKRNVFKEHMDAHLSESPPYCELCDIYFMAIYPKRRLLEHYRKKHFDSTNTLEDVSF